MRTSIATMGACVEVGSGQITGMGTNHTSCITKHDAKISLIVTTLGRRNELRRLLVSLADQRHKPYEVIIVDQNPPGWLGDTLAPFLSPILPLITVSSNRGAALGRNRGATIATGDILGFPDDDCWYESDVLENINRQFYDLETQGLCIPLSDENNQPIMVKWPQKSVELTQHNIWNVCLMAGFFVRRLNFQQIAGFNEVLGVGAVSGFESGEETDLALRLLSSGDNLRFSPLRGAHHPQRPPISSLTQRARSYGRGFGYVFALHKLPCRFFAWYLLRAFGGAAISLIRGKTGNAQFYWQSFLGRCEGWRAGRITDRS